MFEFAEISLTTWAILAGLVILGVVLYIMTRDQKKWSTRMLANASLCIALAFILSYVKLYEMPQGGSVTLASMLPIFMFAYAYGVGPGLVLGAVYGMLDFALGGWFLSVPQFLMDYPVAFAMCGLAGLFHKSSNTRLGLSLGVVIGSLGRYVAAVAAGILFWSDLTEGLAPALIYSLGYNGTYMAAECVICVVISILMGERLVRELKKVA